jgi:A/G-specific adenine glycosylase
VLGAEADDRPFGAAADGASDVQRRAGAGPAREDKSTQHRHLRIEEVDPVFQALDIVAGHGRLRDAMRHLAAGICQTRTDSEQIPLNPLEHRRQPGIAADRTDETQPRVEFVDLAVCGDSRIGFRDTLSTKESGFTAVAGLGVDFHPTSIGGFVQDEFSMSSGRRARKVTTTTKRSPQQVPLPAARQRFRRRLLEWYRQYGRDLPWRQTRDPYHILVSEVMLQQTQVDRVLPKYEEWLQKYPTLEALAAAPETDVSHTWRPLGYNIRPKRLHAIARESMARYGGQLPSDEATLLSFKGIGEYTAGAVLSFAFGQRAAILDTNVARVLFRVFIGRGDAKSHAMRRHLWDVSRAVLPHRHVFDFNQALMDFGATLCTARNPKCLICPMRRSCTAYPFNPEHERAAR